VCHRGQRGLRVYFLPSSLVPYCPAFLGSDRLVLLRGDTWWEVRVQLLIVSALLLEKGPDAHVGDTRVAPPPSPSSLSSLPPSLLPSLLPLPPVSFLLLFVVAPACTTKFAHSDVVAVYAWPCAWSALPALPGEHP
jgi:hypothetical protein